MQEIPSCDPTHCALQPGEADLRRAMRADVFRALGEPMRLEVVTRLACSRSPLTVSEITECCGIHISGVSRHLRHLESAGIVTGTRNGREVRYVLDHATLSHTLRSLLEALQCCRIPEENES